MNFLRSLSVVPAKLTSVTAKDEWEEVYFRPNELDKARAALLSQKKVWLVPVKHYNSQQFIDVFKMLEEYNGDKACVRLNLPWASPGSWCGCSTSCERHEELVAKDYTITRQLV